MNEHRNCLAQFQILRLNVKLVVLTRRDPPVHFPRNISKQNVVAIVEDVGFCRGHEVFTITIAQNQIQEYTTSIPRLYLAYT